MKKMKTLALSQFFDIFEGNYVVHVQEDISEADKIFGNDDVRQGRNPDQNTNGMSMCFVPVFGQARKLQHDKFAGGQQTHKDVITHSGHRAYKIESQE